MAMELVQVRLPAKLVAELDAHVQGGMYANRSDVIRQALRAFTMQRLQKMIGIAPYKGDSVALVRAARKKLGRTIDSDDINRP
jgi:Arc/MetJ-type ribon-helix-helix transcriptional regulator